MTEYSSELWTGRTGGLWARCPLSRGCTPGEAWKACVRAAVRRLRGVPERGRLYRARFCQYRVVKGVDNSQDVYCFARVRPEHYFLCKKHFEQIIRTATARDKYKAVSVPRKGAFLWRVIGDKRGWYRVRRKRANWQYWYILKRAYNDNPYREFRL